MNTALNRLPSIATALALGLMLTACAPLAGGPPADDAPATSFAAPPVTTPPEISRRIVSDDGVTVAELSNGLTVIVKPTRTAPVVSVRAVVHTGGIYEGKWLGTGISHLTEHLVAKGAVHDMGDATAAEAKQTSDRVSEIGGQSNAYTSLDHTSYYISATAGKTDACIDLVADWMARPEITREDFDREHGVVQRELETGKDDPGRQMWYAHSAELFGDHPAAVPVIGYAAPLAGLTCQDVLDYHAEMYVPQNMVFCVVGDVDAESVLHRVRRAFAGFGAGRTPELILPAVAPLAGIRRSIVPHEAISEDIERLSFQTIPLVDEDLYPLDVLSYVLTEGEASRLFRTIQRERELVTSISSSSWTPAWGRGAFTFAFRTAPGRADAAEQAILDELRDVVENGVTDAQLARAKRQKIADYVYSQQTVDSISRRLATDYLTTRQAQFSADYTRRIQSVTAEQVRAAAEKYFTFDRYAVTRMVPTGGDDAQPTTQPAGDDVDRTASQTVAFALSNGLQVVLHPTDAVGLVSMALVSRGGLLAETETTNGMGTLMTALSTQGAGDRSADEIAAFFDQAGGSIAGQCGNNTFYWQATVLDDSFGGALDILADVVIRPSFPPGELQRLRPILLARIDQIDEQWSSQLQRFFRRTFFTDSPYGMLPIGRKEVIADADVEQIDQWHDRHILAGSSVLAVYGNFDAAEARRQIEAVFAEMPEGELELEQYSPREVPAGGETEVLETDKEIAGIIVAAPGMRVTNLEDRIPLEVLDTIISGYRLPSGWLHTELRGRQLVYVVHAYNWSGLAPGAFVTYAACQPSKAREVVEIIRDQLARASTYEPSADEIDQAVNIILTAELLESQSMSDLALSAALDELYGFGYDFRRRMETLYRAVTPADVLRVGQKYLARAKVTVVTTPAPQELAGDEPDRQDNQDNGNPGSEHSEQ